ncbi:MAG TPA: hypothetical protein PLZ56_00825 [Anaerolineae bacterium]|nr:hypothetical protein [Anaerolineae bacterium]
MQQVIDLARLAEELDSPYRPLDLASLDRLKASLFICDDRRSWHRDGAEGSLLFILDGVVMVDNGTVRTVANEGELLSVPRKVGHTVSAGMRSTVLLLETVVENGAVVNGHLPPHMALDHEIHKAHAAADALRAEPFRWQALGHCGAYTVCATRLWGQSESYIPATGPLVLIVYRGVLEYQIGAEGAPGVAVGSQILIAPAATPLRLRSERGATVLVMAHGRQEPPQPAGATSVGTIDQP